MGVAKVLLATNIKFCMLGNGTLNKSGTEIYLWLILRFFFWIEKVMDFWKWIWEIIGKKLNIWRVQAEQKAVSSWKRLIAGSQIYYKVVFGHAKLCLNCYLFLWIFKREILFVFFKIYRGEKSCTKLLNARCKTQKWVVVKSFSHVGVLLSYNMNGVEIKCKHQINYEGRVKSIRGKHDSLRQRQKITRTRKLESIKVSFYYKLFGCLTKNCAPVTLASLLNIPHLKVKFTVQ